MDPYPPDISAPFQLERLLAGRGRVHRVIRGAQGLFSQYFLSARLAEQRPDQVILALNLDSFGPHYLAIERSELAGWLPAGSWTEAAGFPLEKVGVTADRLLFHRTLLAGGLGPAWRRLQQEQARVVEGRKALGRTLQAAAGLPPEPPHDALHQASRAAYSFAPERTDRPSRAFARELLEPVLAGLPEGHFGLRVLDATLRTLHGAGIPVLVYVAPINVEFLTDLGVHDAEAVASSVARIRLVAERNGARFVDLHALLGDAHFRDALGHLRHDRGPGGARRIAVRLADEMAGPPGRPPGPAPQS